MELILARQSVITKCRLQASIMIGNYEFYYAGGLLCRLAGMTPEQELQPKELYAFLQTPLDTYKPQNDQESYLIKMLKDYKVPDEYDDQMPQLMQMGLTDRDFAMEARP